jgi:inosose dehydratase
VGGLPADDEVRRQDDLPARLLPRVEPGEAALRRRGHLCPDTGHPSYRACDDREGLLFAEPVRPGVMVEPPACVLATEPVLGARFAVDADLFTAVEEDLYSCDPAVPFPIAQRTRRYLGGRGLYSRPRER